MCPLFILTHTFLVLVTVGIVHGLYRKLYTLIGGQRAEKFENHCFRRFLFSQSKMGHFIHVWQIISSLLVSSWDLNGRSIGGIVVFWNVSFLFIFLKLFLFDFAVAFLLLVFWEWGWSVCPSYLFIPFDGFQASSVSDDSSKVFQVSRACAAVVRNDINVALFLLPHLVLEVLRCDDEHTDFIVNEVGLSYLAKTIAFGNGHGPILSPA